MRDYEIAHVTAKRDNVRNHRAGTIICASRKTRSQARLRVHHIVIRRLGYGFLKQSQ